MDDLVQWYGEQLDVEERAARESGGAAWEELPVSGWVHTSPLPTTEWQPPGYDHHVASAPLPADRAHIVRHDPARVLREIEAKRQLLADIASERHLVNDGDCWYTCPAATEERDGGETCDDSRRGGACDCGRDSRAKRRVRLLALPYADRPGYLEKWRP